MADCMNALTVLVLVVGLGWTAVLAVDYRRRGRGTPGARTFMAAFAAVTFVLSAAGYASLGRWSDWQVEKTNHDVGYLLTTQITEAQRRVKMAPQSAAARVALGDAHLEAGFYREAVEDYRAAIGLSGPRAELYGKTAYALYYRDGRRMSGEARAAADQALALNRLDVQTRMLLGQDAFLNGRYEEAIAQWRMLLDSGAAPAQTRALRNAIANAESRARQQD